MRPSVRAEKIRDASGWRKDVTDGKDNGTDGQTDRQSATQYAAPSWEEGRIISCSSTDYGITSTVMDGTELTYLLDCYK